MPHVLNVILVKYVEETKCQNNKSVEKLKQSKTT